MIVRSVYLPGCPSPTDSEVKRKLGKERRGLRGERGRMEARIGEKRSTYCPWGRAGWVTPLVGAGIVDWKGKERKGEVRVLGEEKEDGGANGEEREGKGKSSIGRFHHKGELVEIFSFSLFFSFLFFSFNNQTSTTVPSSQLQPCPHPSRSISLWVSSILSLGEPQQPCQTR